MAEGVDWYDWQALEQRIPLDELPTFHRAFLALARPDEDFSSAPLRKVQGKVQASLKQLERDGKAKIEGDGLQVAAAYIPAAFRSYAEDA